MIYSSARSKLAEWFRGARLLIEKD